ncbi:MAG: hypothetical protein HFI53_12970 [Lachnospiraceae bacterium]|nr:hypothetical protein [Lachnospiraceae bacterium]
MSDRKEKIIEVAEGLIPDIWQRSSMETGQFCEKRSRELAEGFLLVIEQGIRQIIRDGGKESLEQIRYLLFSCLHSSIFSKKYLVRMELAGEELYLKEPLTVVYWDAGDIYRLFERDIESIRRGMDFKIPRIRSYEVDEIRYAYAPYYHGMAKEFIREMMAGIVENINEPTNREEQEQIAILFGEYMGEADVLCRVERKQMNEIFQYLCG